MSPFGSRAWINNRNIERGIGEIEMSADSGYSRAMPWILLHFPQAVFDDVADRHDADQPIPVNHRNVSDSVCGHPLHDGDRRIGLATGRDLAGHDLR